MFEPKVNSPDDLHMCLDEEKLVSQAVTGDEEALTTLLDHYGPILRRQISPQIESKWKTMIDADDVMQTTYLEAFLRIDRFTYRGPGSFDAWLKQISRNNLRDAIKELSRLKRPQPDARVRQEDVSDSAVALFEALACTTTTPSRHAARREVVSAVESAVTQLPTDYSVVVRMYDLEGAPASDVAASMGRSVGAIYMLRARAHDFLRESFAAQP